MNRKTLNQPVELLKGRVKDHGGMLTNADLTAMIAEVSRMAGRSEILDLIDQAFTVHPFEAFTAREVAEIIDKTLQEYAG